MAEEKRQRRWRNKGKDRWEQMQRWQRKDGKDGGRTKAKMDEK